MGEREANEALARLQQQHHDLVGRMSARLVLVTTELTSARTAIDMVTSAVGLEAGGGVELAEETASDIREALHAHRRGRTRTEQFDSDCWHRRQHG
jgi:hypothetical protein